MTATGDDDIQTFVATQENTTRDQRYDDVTGSVATRNTAVATRNGITRNRRLRVRRLRVVTKP
ncbi:hypothetical protein HanRHA438_Chr02g0079381 [Helianthus annuus]|nr:hypothetical protein HanRHA438_Chr02g0079381 [Helianthus annuus]